VYCVHEGSRLWVAHRRRMMYEVQAALQQMTRTWSENHDDVFLAPLQLQGDTLIQVRRREGVPSALVEGCQAASGQPIWTSRIATPIVALASSQPRQAVVVLTQDGRVYSLKGDNAQAGIIEEPSYSPRGNSTAILPTAVASADGQSLVWTESKASGRVFTYDASSGRAPQSVSLPGEALAPAQPFANGFLTPLKDGSVALVPPGGGAPVSPFLPPLTPGELPRWKRPAVLGSSFVISDGRGTVYAVSKKDQPQAHLATVGETRTPGPIVSPLVVAGGAAIGVLRLESADALAGFDAQGAAAFEPVALQGRVEAGPFAIGGLVFVAAEPDGLVCAEASGKIRWRQPLDDSPLAGPPHATSAGDLVVLHQSGIVSRLDAATGKSIAQHDVGEPLGAAACILGEEAFAAGSDGTIHRFPLPARP
jgi:outer membrane protein assembly factor BamB